MEIYRRMDTEALRERMGDEATIEAAEDMRDWLLEHGYTDTVEVPEADWLDAVEDAVRRAERAWEALYS